MIARVSFSHLRPLVESSLKVIERLGGEIAVFRSDGHIIVTVIGEPSVLVLLGVGLD